MVDQLEDRIRVLVDPWQQLIVELSSVFFQLGPRQVPQVVVSLSDQLFRIEERVDEQTAARHLSGHPAVEASIKLSLRHLASLHSTESGPVVDSQVADAGEKDFNHTSAKIVGDEQVWVDQVQLIDEHLKHLSFVLEDRDVSVSLRLDLLLEIEWKRLLVEFAQQREALELFIPGRTILIYLVLHYA